VTVLTLATLSDVTKNRNDPICIAPPKVAKASKEGVRYRRHFRQRKRSSKAQIISKSDLASPDKTIRDRALRRTIDFKSSVLESFSSRGAKFITWKNGAKFKH
jgi:hypothetical protein